MKRCRERIERRKNSRGIKMKWAFLNIWPNLPIILSFVICWTLSNSMCLKSNRVTQKDEARHSNRGRAFVLLIYQWWNTDVSPEHWHSCSSPCPHTHPRTYVIELLFHMPSPVSFHTHPLSPTNVTSAVGLRYRAQNSLCAHGHLMWCFILHIHSHYGLYFTALSCRIHNQLFWL